jgi:5-hydroxyisourate hydrolase
MISTHILDTSKGVPATGVPVKLQVQNGHDWKNIGEGITNSDGRFAFEIAEKHAGVYQILFDIEHYYKRNPHAFFFITAPVIFKIEDTSRNYHVPLLLNPFGYTTYRGT